ncbi:peptidyl-prolyl cis-trans isomerase [uncultured Sphingomonas sp.]|uniref:peptidyl-prolyl cis-trans isomerase n=1 Tax=uncultured Sphingomonas sp. TaxID=158754 RepID=UPI002634F39D|nr:peptidyl-prolyl cis-trans isomerase [uncultured Sphingomonas sp.]
MLKKSGSITVLFACAALAGCGKGAANGAPPTGQVAATVDGKEITASEVRLELGPLAGDPSASERAQPAALQSIVNRKILADAAVERGLDKTPAAAILLQKARDMALIQLLEQSVRANLPKVSPDEAAAYVRDNPQAFAQRQLVSVDQVIVGPVKPELVQQLGPLKTMEEITALLDKNNIEYRRSAAVIDPMTIPPEAAKQIADLKINDVFILPNNGGVMVARIRERQSQPFSGNEANQIATQILTNQRAQNIVREQFAQIIKQGEAKVNINPQYKPQAAPAAAKAGAAPAPAKAN